MKISDLMEALGEIQGEHGDVEVYVCINNTPGSLEAAPLAVIDPVGDKDGTDVFGVVLAPLIIHKLEGLTIH